MKQELFAELLESVREGGVIFRGEKSPSRTFVIEAASQQPEPHQENDKRK